MLGYYGIFYITHLHHQAPSCRMTKPPSKRDRLIRELGVLNPHPDRIRAPLVSTRAISSIPTIMVQVKYEMLRHVQVDGASKAEAAALFGMSRPTFYQAESAFASEGLPGLAAETARAQGRAQTQLGGHGVHRGASGSNDGSDPRSRAWHRRSKPALELSVHPRSIERALARKKKP